jgi:hypothetical protein
VSHSSWRNGPEDLDDPDANDLLTNAPRDLSVA